MLNAKDALLAVSGLLGGNGSGGTAPTLIPKTVTANGTYDPADDSADGYSSVTVNVPTGDADLMKQNLADTLTEYIDLTSTKIRDNAFSGSSIRRVYMPNVTTIGSSAFRDARKINVPLCFPKASVGGNAFYLCSAPKIVIKEIPGWAAGACGNNSSLTAVDILNSGFSSGCFQSCTNLNTMVLRMTTVAPAGNVNAFFYSPFASGGTGGTIYIPKSLYDHLGDGTSLDYKSATNWSTLDGYGTITWAQIEGSVYETQYVDGTPIGS